MFSPKQQATILHVFNEYAYLVTMVP